MQFNVSTLTLFAKIKSVIIVSVNDFLLRKSFPIINFLTNEIMNEPCCFIQLQKISRAS